MSVIIDTAIEKIAKQQEGKENTAAYMVGEQLKGIIRGNDTAAELVIQDLENPDMSLEKCEQKIKEYADKQEKHDNCVCVPPNVAEGIIRKFYGISEQAAEKSGTVSLMDLM